MPRYSPEQRTQFAEYVCSLVNEWLVQRESEFDLEVERGVEWCTDARTGDRMPRANPTLTLILKINGGAQESQGQPVVLAPPVFLGPKG